MQKPLNHQNIKFYRCKPLTIDASRLFSKIKSIHSCSTDALASRVRVSVNLPILSRHTSTDTQCRAYREQSPQQTGSLNPRANEHEVLAHSHRVGAAGRLFATSPSTPSPLRYTSAWHRLSHSGLRRRVRVCARTSKPHSTHLLICVRGKERQTGTLSSITAGNSPLPYLCSLLGD